jgi:L-iditol 2-dehydrogenase
MKAAVIEKPTELVVREVPQPIPGDYDALCELLFGATCTGTDLHLIDGVFPWPPVYPAILGHESVGRVIATGSKVKNFKIGDLVTRVGAPKMPAAGLDVCWGGFAEFGLARDHWEMQRAGLPEAEWSPYRVNQLIPAGINPEIAPMMITWRETFSYLTRMGVKPGASVLVMGSGGNGLSLAAHAVNLGASPVVMVGGLKRQEAALKVGVSQFLDFRASGWISQLAQIAPAGFDFVIDALGKQASIQESFKQVCRNGVYGIYGIDDFGQLSLDPFQSRGGFRYYPNEYDEAEAHGAICNFILAGKLDASVWYDGKNPIPLDRIGVAYASLRRKAFIKVLIQIKP